MSANQFPHPFHKLEKEFKILMEKLPLIVSSVAELEFKENFRRQGYEETPGAVTAWAKRKNDARKGRAILIKTGRLRRAFKKRPTHDTAVVINDTPYAAVHNEGDKSRVNVKGHSYKGKNSRKVVYIRPHKRQNNTPARPFMKHTRGLVIKIDKRIEKELLKLF